ncbi:MAG: PD40 domain-containing protein, partial [Deltaproteobacteria bacterium]|nr:PD40 domain-containing protein [Deltaproteobacteria bacterium]
MKSLSWAVVGIIAAVALAAGPAVAAGTDWGQLGVADTDRVEKIVQVTDNSADDRVSAPYYTSYFYTDAWRSGSQWIVYTSIPVNSGLDTESSEIWVVKPDGSGANKLTENSVEDANAGFTPDGNDIVFERNVICEPPKVASGEQPGIETRREIWKMGFSESGLGTDPVSLTLEHLGPCEVPPLQSRNGCVGIECIEDEKFAKVSPDGTMIAFLAYEDSGSDLVQQEGWYLWVMDMDGSNPRKVSGSVEIFGCNEPQHSWSPDSQWVLFTGKGGTHGKAVIYRTKPDGITPPEAFTPDDINLNSIWAVWSPDGAKIAYTRHETIEPLPLTPGIDMIYQSTVTLMDPDGTEKTDLVTFENYDGEFQIPGPKSWDPGSTYIAYTVREFNGDLKGTIDSSRSIWMVSRDGLENIQLTENYCDFEPRWSPDGTLILFADDKYNVSRDGNEGVSGSKEAPGETTSTYDLLVLYFDIDETFDDGDGVTSTEESGPAGDDPAYDGDENGTPDYLQNSAASLHAESGDYVTLGLDQTNNASFNEDVQAVPPPGTPPNGLTFPLGFFSYSIDIDEGACTTVTIYAPKDESITSFWKYDDTNGYYE